MKFAITLILALVQVVYSCAQQNLVFDYQNQFDSTSHSCVFAIVLKSAVIHYPEQAMQENIEGLVIMSFDITDSLEFENIEVLQSLGYGLDEIALNVVAELQKDMKTRNIMPCAFRTNFRLPVGFSIR